MELNIAHTFDIPLGRAVYLPKAIASVQLGMCSIEDVVRLVISLCLVPARRPAWSCHHPLPPPPPPQALVPGNWIHEREAGSIHLYTPYLTLPIGGTTTPRYLSFALPKSPLP